MNITINRGIPRLSAVSSRCNIHVTRHTTATKQMQDKKYKIRKILSLRYIRKILPLSPPRVSNPTSSSTPCRLPKAAVFFKRQTAAGKINTRREKKHRAPSTKPTLCIKPLTGHGNGLDVVAAQLDLVLHVRRAHVIDSRGKLHPAQPSQPSTNQNTEIYPYGSKRKRTDERQGTQQWFGRAWRTPTYERRSRKGGERGHVQHNGSVVHTWHHSLTDEQRTRTSILYTYNYYYQVRMKKNFQ